MLSRLFKNTYVLDEAYMPIFVSAWQAVQDFAAFDLQAAIDKEISKGGCTPDRMKALLMEQDTPVRAMLKARERLRDRRPTDGRFSTNLHRRMIELIDWQEKHLSYSLMLRACDPTDETRGGERAFWRATRRNHAAGWRVRAYAKKITAELQSIYEQFPDLRPYLQSMVEYTD